MFNHSNLFQDATLQVPTSIYSSPSHRIRCRTSRNLWLRIECAKLKSSSSTIVLMCRQYYCTDPAYTTLSFTIVSIAINIITNRFTLTVIFRCSRSACGVFGATSADIQPITIDIGHVCVIERIGAVLATYIVPKT